jgi:adhesin transport system membrane fusion protein
VAQPDFAFANDIRAAVELRTPRTSRMLLTSSLAMFVAFVVWAHFAVLDEVKRGNGKVIRHNKRRSCSPWKGALSRPSWCRRALSFRKISL